eukprot:4952252-Pleurochrysis_carterae.AAC.1
MTELVSLNAAAAHSVCVRAPCLTATAPDGPESHSDSCLARNIAPKSAARPLSGHRRQRELSHLHGHRKRMILDDELKHSHEDNLQRAPEPQQPVHAGLGHELPVSAAEE